MSSRREMGRRVGSGVARGSAEEAADLGPREPASERVGTRGERTKLSDRDAPVGDDDVLPGTDPVEPRSQVRFQLPGADGDKFHVVHCDYIVSADQG